MTHQLQELTIQSLDNSPLHHGDLEIKGVCHSVVFPRTATHIPTTMTTIVLDIHLYLCHFGSRILVVASSLPSLKFTNILGRRYIGGATRTRPITTTSHPKEGTNQHSNFFPAIWNVSTFAFKNSSSMYGFNRSIKRSILSYDVIPITVRDKLRKILNQGAKDILW